MEYKTSLFIISTPLQLLSAIEAQKYFNIKNIILIILGANKQKLAELTLLSKEMHCEDFVLYKEQNITISCFSPILRKLKKYNFKYVFTGSYEKKNRGIIGSITYKYIFMLDDISPTTIQVHKTIYQDHQIIENKIKSKILKICNITSLHKNLDNVSFFTIYKLTQSKNEQIINHNFEHVQKLIVTNKINGKYFQLLQKVFNSEFFYKKQNSHIKDFDNNIEKSIEELKYTTLMNQKIYIYPTVLENYNGYRKNILNFLEKNEKILHHGTSDADRVSALQFSLIYLDEITYQRELDELTEILIDRLNYFLSNNETIYLKRFIGLLSILNQVMRFLFYSTNYFIYKKGYFIRYDSFYRLFDLIVQYIKMIEDNISAKSEETILNHTMWIFSHYAKRASIYGEANEVNMHLEKHKHVLKPKVEDILYFSTIYPYHKESCTYHTLLKNAYKQHKRNLSTESLFKAIKLSFLLDKNLDIYCEYYLRNNRKFKNTEEKINILTLLLESPKYYPLLREELWMIYIDQNIHRSFRVKCGLSLVTATRKTGKISQAQELYLNLYHTLGCNSRRQAVSYIGQLEPLGILYTHREIFESLYYKFIFTEFMTEMNVDLTKDILSYQSIFSKLDKLKSVDFLYQTILKPKVEKLIQNKNYHKIIYINPFHEMNQFTFSINFYNELLNHNFLIINIERGYIEFFNSYPDVNLPLLANANDTVYDSFKHWNNFYFDWNENYAEKSLLCNDINIFQGLYEQLSRVQKKFTIDYNALATKKLVNLFRPRIDRNMFVAKYFIDNSNVSTSFYSCTSHYSPWSIYRDISLKYNHLDFSFIHACPTYENYVHKMSNKHLSTIAVLNLTKYKDSRIAGFGGSELFLEYVKKEYSNFTIPKKEDTSVEIDHTDAYMREIIKAKQEGKTIVCLLGKIVYDLAVPYMGGTFSDMSDWVQKTVKFTLKRDDIFVLIKPHPHEQNFAMSQYPNQSFLDFVEGTSQNIYKMGFFEAALDKLIDFVDVFVLWNGTSVLELAKAKANILVCDDWACKDYPIDLYQPKDEHEYFQLILNAKKWDKNSTVAKKRRKLAYMYIEYMSRGDFVIKNTGVVKSSTNIDWENTYFHMNKISSEMIFPTTDGWNKAISNL